MSKNKVIKILFAIMVVFCTTMFAVNNANNKIAVAGSQDVYIIDFDQNVCDYSVNGESATSQMLSIVTQGLPENGSGNGLQFNSGAINVKYAGFKLMFPNVLKNGTQYRISYDINIISTSASENVPLYTKHTARSQFMKTISGTGSVNINEVFTGSGTNSLVIFYGVTDLQARFVIDNIVLYELIDIHNVNITNRPQNDTVEVNDESFLLSTDAPYGSLVIWSSSNKHVVQVSQNGLVIIGAVGYSLITAEMKFEGITYSDSFELRVNDFENGTYLCYDFDAHTPTYEVSWPGGAVSLIDTNLPDSKGYGLKYSTAGVPRTYPGVKLTLPKTLKADATYSVSLKVSVLSYSGSLPFNMYINCSGGLGNSSGAKRIESLGIHTLNYLLNTTGAANAFSIFIETAVGYECEYVIDDFIFVEKQDISSVSITNIPTNRAIELDTRNLWLSTNAPFGSEVIWKSSNEHVAQVDNGDVILTKDGLTTISIIATYYGEIFKDSFELIVSDFLGGDYLLFNFDNYIPTYQASWPGGTANLTTEDLPIGSEGYALKYTTGSQPRQYPGVKITLPTNLESNALYMVSFRFRLINYSGQFPANLYINCSEGLGSSSGAIKVMQTGSYAYSYPLYTTGAAQIFTIFIETSVARDCTYILDDLTFDKITPSEQRLNNFYGIGEMFSGAIDSAQTPEMVLNLTEAMGMTSFRMWMHNTSVLQRGSGDTITLRSDRVAQYKDYISSLYSKGVTKIVAMSHYNLYPSDFNVSGDTLGVFPSPGSAYYADFMNMVEQSYYTLAETFNEIIYWEPSNEINVHNYCHKADGSQFTMLERANITTDLMFYANRGIKRANPNAKLVMPGLVFDNSPTTGLVPFLEAVYSNINSANFPTADETVSTCSNDYFDVLNWHPYNFNGDSGLDSSFIVLNRAAYKVAYDNGDGDKNVIFSEFGYTTTQSSQYTRTQYENMQAQYINQDMQNTLNLLPFVDSVIMFRLFDWEEAAIVTGNPNSIEIGFGLFTSANYGYIRPKKICIELFKQINGQDADLSPIYQYSN